MYIQSLLNLDKQMRIIGSDTVNKYDRFKEQVLHKKTNIRNQKQKNQPKRPINQFKPTRGPTSNPFFRKILSLALITGGLYIANQKFKLVNQVIKYFDSIEMNPIDKASLVALFSDIERRLYKKQDHRTLFQQKNIHFANTCFLSQMNSHLANINQINQSRTLFEQVNSSVRFGLLRFGCTENRMFINSEGNLMRLCRKCKLKIGNIALLGQKVQQIIKYENTINIFTKHPQANLNVSCQIVNYLNSKLLSKQQYDIIYRQCLVQSQKVHSKIQQKMKKIIDKGNKTKQNKKFFISLS